jgi:glycerol-3-phosphate O-acyltransferase / dihydroxyacetone phosphate acyltransferase
VFERIADHLARGGNILIFPEGTSHSEPTLAPLRTGAARMLAAGAARGADATFQAVGLEFDARDDFRSRCLVLWGPVRAFADVPGASPDERVHNATAIMAADLRELLVEGDTHDERRLVARVAELFANDAGDGTLRGWNAIGRQVELAGRTLRGADAAIVDRVRARVGAYYAELERLGVKDAQVVARVADPAGAAQPARDHRLRRVLLAPLAISGIALYAIPYFVPRFVAQSSDTDAKSTVKLGVALVVYPVWAAGLVGLSLLLPPPLSLVAAAVALASPFAALDWLDAWWARDAHRALDLTQLASLRDDAHAAIAAARTRLT